MAIVAVAALATTGCGSSGKDLADVKPCLTKLGMKVESSPKSDSDVRKGLFAATDITDSNVKDFTFVMAAYVKNEDRIKEFKEKSETFAKDAASDGKLKVESGVDGDYVWVVGGAKGGEVFDDARDCVKP